MDPRFRQLDGFVSMQALLGYLNFSAGKPDPRFQKQLADACMFLAQRGEAAPWQALAEDLQAKLEELHQARSPAFGDITQARAVIDLALGKVLAAYRAHHADLLFHQTDRDLFLPFFLARVCEAVLQQGGPWDEEERITAGAVRDLNDFVGYRPVAVLENRPKGEVYPQERVRPIPLHLRGVGVAAGRYQELITTALEILHRTDRGILADACFDPALVDELALDPRAYDHGHPVNRRPNYAFGEWDPHCLDLQGRYRRFVVRQNLLEALLARSGQAAIGAAPQANKPQVRSGELLFEAAAVLAGTILMASAVSGSSPTCHDSSVSLSTLIPRIARFREAFYSQLLTQTTGPHGERLREEAARLHQPFGGARQNLNQTLALQRATQLQQRHLAILLANMGYPDESRAQAARIPTASVRNLTEILVRLKTSQQLAEDGKLDRAVPLLPEIEDLLHRGIRTGCLVDPWNILGFQGQFPFFTAAEDSVHDTRVDELVRIVELTFNLYARLLSEAAAVGDHELRSQLAPQLRSLASWWDQYASVAVSGISRVHGGEAAASAEHVAAALARWHERGAATADLSFWRQHLKAFATPKAFVLVVDALLQKGDHRAALALLMNWLSQAEEVRLEEGEYTFNAMALRWLFSLLPTGDAVGQSAEQSPDRWAENWPLIRRFFDHLEANADSYWQVPRLEAGSTGPENEKTDEDDNIFEAAYENVTYQDTTDDGGEGSLAEAGGPAPADFDLEQDSQWLGPRLRFLATLARLWLSVTRQARCFQDQPEWQTTVQGWYATARGHQPRLLELLDAIQACPVPEPGGTPDSFVEYDRRRGIKEQLLETAIGTCVDMALVVRGLHGVCGDSTLSGKEAGVGGAWVPLVIPIERALVLGDRDLALDNLKAFVKAFRREPLLYTPLDAGGQPRQILRIRLVQTTLRSLLEGLPRLGLLRETFDLLQTARHMEQVEPPQGRRVTEFDRLFQAAFQAVIEAVIHAAPDWEGAAGGEPGLVRILETLTRPFLTLWIEHSQTLRLSAMEAVNSEDDWRALRDFIQRYGNDLFDAKFMTLGNLRGILHRGVGAFLDYLAEDPDPLHPVRLLEEIGRNVPRERAIHFLQIILQAVVENYDIYKDYNSTTPQSDYGANLHTLLEYLRVKASYDRHAWHYRPLILAHEIMARRGRTVMATLWQEAFTRLGRDRAQQHLEDLHRLEQKHGMKLRTVADRLEERFVKPLAQDRLCALVEPAMEEARRGGATPAFDRFLQELQHFLAHPTGVGLDVPPWLRRLELEVYRIRTNRMAVVGLAEEVFRMPRVPLTFEDLQRQIQEWEKPA